MSDATAKKEERRKFQAIRGVRDLLPPETALWTRVEQTAHDVFATFGYGEIRLPIFENTELFIRSVGLDSDVVRKETYTFDDREVKIERASDVAAGYETQTKASLDTLTLRPEATASVCRAYIEHNMQQMPQPVKLYYMGPMFRRERPQKGRYRQFYQIGAEVLEAVRPESGRDTGKELAKDAAIDAEVIEMLMTFFDRVGLTGATLYVNSIGHNAGNCRRGYVEKLRAELNKVKGELGEDSQRRIDTNPLRVLDSKLEREQAIIEKLPRIAEHLCDECKTHYAALQRELGMRGVNYQENWRLVRGLDYYMRTTFEITAPGLGSQNAVCGGGRYDGLVELLGGPPTKGIGFAIGEDRLILSLQESSNTLKPSNKGVYIAWIGENAHAAALSTAAELRYNGFRVELPPLEQKLGKALGQAVKLNTNCAVILGETEVTSGEYTVKTLSTGGQEKVSKSNLVDYLNKQFV